MSTNVPFDIDAASDTVDLSIQKMWLKSKADLVEYHKSYYYVEPVKDYITKDSSITSIDSFTKIAENQNIPASSPYQGFSKSYTQSFFAGMLRDVNSIFTHYLDRFGVYAMHFNSSTVNSGSFFQKKS